MIDTKALRERARGDGLSPATASEVLDEIDRLVAEVATARAMAFEVCAHRAETFVEDPHPFDQEAGVCRSLAAEFRALAPLPASLVAVPVETMSEATRAWTFFFAFLDRERLLSDWPDCLADIIEAREALSALIKAK